MTKPGKPIVVFTPSMADEDNTNAQNLTVKQIVARLSPDEFRFIMLVMDSPDPLLAARPNTVLIKYRDHGNTPNLLTRLLFYSPDIYFYPRSGPLDHYFVSMRQNLRLKTALVTHIVMEINDDTEKLYGFQIREGQSVFGNSKFVAESVKKRFGVDAGVIYNGIDRRFFTQTATKAAALDARPVLLYAGSFQERKRVDVVIRQAARRPDADFRLAGRGETEPACRALVEELGCKNVFFLGHLQPSQLADEMRSATVFLFPSILEGHPQVLGQAAACGLPAIAMDVYHPDYLIHGHTGFLVKSDAEMNDALDRLLNDRDLRASMSAAALKHSLKFDWDRIAQQWADVLRAAAAKL
jgi:glycosyltransferase involved in cell wall biosynthesis